MGIHHERDSHARKRIEEQLNKPVELTDESEVDDEEVEAEW
jgi:hypothetical protein